MSTRLENIANANRHYWDRQRHKIDGVANRVEARAKRSDLEQLKLLDQLGLPAKKERARLAKRIIEQKNVKREKVKAK